MDREDEYGNVEYKLLLREITEDRMEQLVSQMAYRLAEGFGECIYIIGIEDDGTFTGIPEETMAKSIENLALIAKRNNSSMTKISENVLDNGNKILEFYIREEIDSKYIDIKVAVAGNVDSGKSTLIGVLTNGKRDNGRGSARTSIFNYNHEVKSGRTSSIAHHILGFNNTGETINYESKRTWQDISRDSNKIISIFDLAGHEKYLRTTILGLSSSTLDMVLIAVGANMGVTRMTKEHIFLCVVLNIPFCFVITKLDIVKDRKNVLEETIGQLKKIVKMPGIRKALIKIKEISDINLCIKNRECVPLFMVSNVTGEGIDSIKYFLNMVPKNKYYATKKKSPVEYHIDTIFLVNGVGTVVGGNLKSGTVKVGDTLFLGPNSGTYVPYLVKSIHIKRTLVSQVDTNCYVCFNLKKALKKNIRKGNVMVSLESQQLVVREFVAQVSVMRTHSTTIKVGYEPVVHVNSVRQCAKILEIFDIVSLREKDEKDKKILRNGDKAKVRFRFKFRGEYITPGMKILLAEGKVKIVGSVV